jgi:hypothetical protein
MWFFSRKPQTSCPSAAACETLLNKHLNNPAQILQQLQTLNRKLDAMSAETTSVAAKLAALDAKLSTFISTTSQQLSDINAKLASASTADEVNALGATVDEIAAKIPG